MHAMIYKKIFFSTPIVCENSILWFSWLRPTFKLCFWMAVRPKFYIIHIKVITERSVCYKKLQKNMLHTHCAKVDALNCMGGFLYLAFAVKRSSGNSLNTTVHCIITVVLCVCSRQLLASVGVNKLDDVSTTLFI